MKKCPKCKNSFRSSFDNFCYDCGSRLLNKKDPPNCKKCGNQVMEVYQYCVNCGAKNPNFRGKNDKKILARLEK